MKIPLITSLVVATVTSAGAIYFYTQSANDNARLMDYETHVQQLLSQAEDNSRERLNQEREIDDLRSEITTLQSQLTALSNQLTIAEAQTDPDYAQLEQEIRRRVRIEYEESQQFDSNRVTNQRVDLIQQIANLDAMELSEIMSLQGQFGPFLQALDVSDERMEEIVVALSSVIDYQNQARQEIMTAAQNQEIGRREMRNQMREVMNPETMFESLSYDLTVDELDLLREVREEQRTQTGYANFSLSSGSTLSVTPGIQRQSGNGSGPAVQIYTPVDPDN